VPAWLPELATVQVSFHQNDQARANTRLAQNKGLIGVSVRRIATINGAIG
jgi:hypothetical protein